MALQYVPTSYQHAELNTQLPIPPSYVLKEHGLRFKRFKTIPFFNFLPAGLAGIVGSSMSIKMCNMDNIEKFIVGISILALPYEGHAGLNQAAIFCGLSDIANPTFAAPPLMRFEHDMFYPAGTGVFNAADLASTIAGSLAVPYPNYIPLSRMEFLAVVAAGFLAPVHGALDKIHASINQPYPANKELWFNQYIFDLDCNMVVYGNLLYMECVKE